jgi:hypothetical protein
MIGEGTLIGECAMTPKELEVFLRISYHALCVIASLFSGGIAIKAYELVAMGEFDRAETAGGAAMLLFFLAYGAMKVAMSNPEKCLRD